jgi:hypothetical protein
MSTRRSPSIDALLADGLARRAEGPRTGTELIDDVLTVVGSSTQVRGSTLRWPTLDRPIAILLAAALALSALLGAAFAVGGRARPPVPATVVGASDEIAFVRATYSWDGTWDRFGAPIPSAVDPRIFRIPGAGGEPVFVAVANGSSAQTPPDRW